MILVTGATGLLGSYLLLELCRKPTNIVALYRNEQKINTTKELFAKQNKESEFNKITWFKADLLDVPALEDLFSAHTIKKIFHAGACISFDERDRKKLLKNNVLATKNLVNFAIEAKIDSFVYFGSIAAINHKKKQKEYTEESEFNLNKAHSSYALSKHLAEMEVWRGGQEGLFVSIFNPGIIIGSLDGQRMSEVIFKMANKRLMFATKAKTAFVDVRDVAKIGAMNLESYTKNQRFILVAEHWSLYQIFYEIRKRLNKPKPLLIHWVILKVFRVLSSFTKVFGFDFFSASTYESVTKSHYYSNQKINQIIDYQWIPIQESIAYHHQNYLACKQNSYPK